MQSIEVNSKGMTGAARARAVVAVDCEALPELARDGACELLYLGDSPLRYWELRGHLPQDWSMPVPGELLNAAARKLRETVIDLDSQAWPDGADPAVWDASLLGERGPLASNIMLSLSRLLVLRDQVAKPGRHVVMVDDPKAARLVLRQLRQLGVPAALHGGKIPGHEAVARLAHDIGWALRVRLSVLVRFFQRKAGLWRLRRTRSLPAGRLRECDVLMIVWGRPDTFPKSGPVSREVNFGRLPALLREAGLRVGYLAFPLTYTAPFEAIAANGLQAQEPVAMVEDLLPWWVIFPANLRGLLLPRQLRRLRLCGLDATELLRREAVRERRLGAMVQSWLWWHVGRALARRGIRPRHIVHLYEAQPWEKMMARGVRQWLPDTGIVGIQHTPIAWDYMSFFPSRRSIETGAIVDRLLVMGEGYRDWFASEGFPSERIGIVGALRYDNLNGEAAAPDEGGVLCCTGIDLDEAVELATKAAQATHGLGLRLVINYHPVTNDRFRQSLRDALFQAAGEKAEHVIFSDRSMRELVSDAAVVLYNTSASCFEAVQAGRLAIYVGREVSLDYDKLPEDMSVRVRTADELRNLLEDWRRSEGRPGRQAAAGLSRWLAPVVEARELTELLKGHDQDTRSLIASASRR